MGTNALAKRPHAPQLEVAERKIAQLFDFPTVSPAQQQRHLLPSLDAAQTRTPATDVDSKGCRENNCFIIRKFREEAGMFT